MSIIPKAIGKIKPLSIPTKTSVFTGFPIKTNINVEKTIKPMIGMYLS
jgi:hypothetical protein